MGQSLPKAVTSIILEEDAAAQDDPGMTGWVHAWSGQGWLGGMRATESGNGERGSWIGGGAGIWPSLRVAFPGGVGSDALDCRYFRLGQALWVGNAEKFPEPSAKDQNACLFCARLGRHSAWESRR